MGHQVSARKYRPGTFADVVGQPFVVQTLRNALRSGKLAHAYLFFGPRGVGKTTCARILAKAINCENLTPEGDPCGECASCRRFAEGRTLNLIELDAASHNSVDDIRLITDQVQLTPPEGRYKVYIIDEAHMLSTAAFNAFLKTLEEPPPHAVFILATTEKHKIPATILSRCQRFDFRRIPVEEITARLGYIAQREGILAEPEALFLIATKSEGGLRDALSLFDQLSSRTGGQLTYTAVLDALEALDYDAYFKISEALQNWDATQALRTLRSYTEAGYEPATLLQGLLEHFRNLLLAQYEPEALGQTIPPHYRSRYEEIAPTYSEAFLLHAIDILLEGERRMSYTRFPEVVIETTFLKVALLPQALQREEVSETAPARPSTAPQAAARPSSSSTAKPSTSLSNIPRSLDEVKKKSSPLDKPPSPLTSIEKP
ncbi:MAG: DNA polymerase III subunit gamma/tau [Bacteroidia bacterium]|nr:DNA polymerase III subunit gamma/tau [Bacteroidia bacterium]MCX7652135.1 DNA polymerase III subunit gamma/tau [Bacteroidia bacterium]MDW8416916.1 DNA polymerase III subunit gamma/tau [Bacteroidia bacterium]